MNFSPEETESLRKQLLVVLEPFTEADPDALLDFILLFINKGSSRDELMETYKNELEVFCEENTSKAVEAVFKVIDEIIAAREGATTTSSEPKATESINTESTAPPLPTTTTTAGQKREKEESEDEDDDDRNFKRRNMNAEDDVRDVPPPTTTTSTVDTSSPSTKRKTPEDISQNNESERPSKVSRSPEQEKVFASLPEHLRKRLGGRDGSSSIPQQQESQPRARLPCRHFEEHGYCLYGDNCKFDHGQNVAVADYSNFQAMFSTPGSTPMTNPMMMNMAGQITPYNMTTSPYGFQNPINMTDQASSSQFLPPPSQQQQQQQISSSQQWNSPHQKPQQQYNNSSNNINKNVTHNNRPHHPQAPQEVPYTTRFTKTSTRLVIEKIPMESCTIDSVTETFKKFGTIVDIELQPENQRAFLEFKTHEEALEAHQSPEVLFNNRFVKVYWRKESMQRQQQQEQAYQQQQQPAEPDPELVKQRAAELAKKREEQQRRKKEQLEKQIEYNKKKQEIARRNLELAMLKAKVAEMEAKKQGASTKPQEEKESTDEKK